MPRIKNRTITRYDYPEEPPREVFEIDDGSLKKRIEHKNGNITVTLTGKVNITTKAQQLKIEKGHKVVDCGIHRIEGNREHVFVIVPDDVYSRLQDLNEEHEQWRDDAETWVRNHELSFVVEEHDYRIGTYDTKYNVTDKVMKPNKGKHDMTDEEKRVWNALISEYGEADGYPKSSGTDFEVGTTITLKDAEKKVSNRIQELINEEKEAERWNELVDEYPGLRGLPLTTDDALAAIGTAEDTGKSQTLSTFTDHCNDRRKECNIDHVTVSVTPTGDIEKSRTHTY